MKKQRTVYLIQQGKDKNYWKPVGVAFENKDGSLNVKLDFFPQLNFQIRENNNGDK